MFYLFGIIPIPLLLSPIVVIVILQCMVPRSHSISHAVGLLSGYLLAIGLLKILTNSYWTYLFFIDIFLLAIWWKNNNNQSAILINERRDDIFEVLSINNNYENQNDEFLDESIRSDHELNPLIATMV